MKWAVLVADARNVERVEVIIVMIRSRLVEVVSSVLPVPITAAILRPIVVCRRTSTDPGVVVHCTTPSQHFATRVRLLDSSVFGAIDHGRLVAPVVLAAAKFESTSGSSDLGNFRRVTALIST